MLRTLPHRVPEGRSGPYASLLGVAHQKPDLVAGKTVLVAHGNSLRSLVQAPEIISDEDIASLNIPPVFRCTTGWMGTSSPSRLAVPGPGGSKDAIAAVANQGKVISPADCTPVIVMSRPPLGWSGSAISVRFLHGESA